MWGSPVPLEGHSDGAGKEGAIPYKPSAMGLGHPSWSLHTASAVLNVWGVRGVRVAQAVAPGFLVTSPQAAGKRNVYKCVAGKPKGQEVCLRNT